MSDETLVPAIPSITAENIVAIAKAVKQILDVREGRIGNTLDANVTFRDLVAAGAVTLRPGWNSRMPNPVIPAWYESDGYDPSADTTLPPSPSGFIVTSGLTSIMLQWSDPAYRNHSYTEVWRSATNVIGSAILVGTSDTRFFVDAVGETGTGYYYWVRFVSKANVFSAYNSTVGVLGQTGLVGGTDLANLIVDASKLAANAVESGKIKDYAVTTTKIANLAVGNAAIANLAVTNAKIADLAVDNAKIASLDAAKINTGYLSADRIQAGSLDVKIANISAAVITSGTINTARIGDATIGFAKLANDIQSSNYVAGSAGWKIDKTGQMEMNNATFRGTIDVKSASSGQRMQITNSVLSVYDSSNVERVRIGSL